eukprot:GEZU01038849.1.p1 GENE.GEZU01038849.1~~GEZU01038849.1.p1  ORF type:complete len:237 (-),score=90.50 GEZU01038849.1:25-735(-)
MNKIILSVVVIFALVFSAQAMPIKDEKHALDLDLCGVCVNLADQALQQLINIIANAGIVGGCADLCGKLPNHIEADACNLICDAAGIDAFVHAIEKADLDPIYYCQLIKLCPVHDCTGTCANITSITVNPPSGPQGTQFTVNIQFTVFNQTGAGELAIDIVPQDADSFGDSQLVPEGFAPNSYQINFQFTATPSENEPFNAGTYQVAAGICEGMCGATHPHSAILAEATTTFEITA